MGEGMKRLDRCQTSCQVIIYYCHPIAIVPALPLQKKVTLNVLNPEHDAQCPDTSQKNMSRWGSRAGTLKYHRQIIAQKDRRTNGFKRSKSRVIWRWRILTLVCKPIWQWCRSLWYRRWRDWRFWLLLKSRRKTKSRSKSRTRNLNEIRTRISLSNAVASTNMTSFFSFFCFVFIKSSFLSAI